jgi:hypothetical protein
MDILGWLWWGIVKILGLVWSFVWFLLGGWVSTLMQLVILGGAIFAMKYGWRRAPQEMWTRAQSVGRFVWAWARAKEPRLATSARPEVLGSKEAIRVVHARKLGDVSLSTLLTAVMLAGLLVAGAL